MNIKHTLLLGFTCSQALFLAGCLGGGSSGGGGGGGSGSAGNGGGSGGDGVSYQWRAAELPLEARYAMHDVFFVNDSTGWIVGEGPGFMSDIIPGGGPSVILRSTDGGANWTEQESGTLQFLQGAHFVDENRGWAASGNVLNEPPAVLRTTNQGETWSLQELDPSLDDANLFDVHFVDANTGWAVGGESGGNFGTKLILGTTDGGANWSAQLNERIDLPGVFDPDWNGDASVLRAVWFLDASNGWAVPGPQRGTYYRTRDGGANWEVEDTRITEQTGLFTSRWDDVFFVDEQRGWVVGGGMIMATRDGGSSWVVQASTGGPIFNAIFFVDADIGWAAGSVFNGDAPAIVRTTNGGATWELQDIDAGDQAVTRLNAIFARDADTAWAVGDGGTYLIQQRSD